MTATEMLERHHAFTAQAHRDLLAAQERDLTGFLSSLESILIRNKPMTAAEVLARHDRQAPI